MSNSLFRADRGGRYAQIDGARLDSIDDANVEVQISPRIAALDAALKRSPSGDPDYEWRVSEDGTLKRIIRRPSVSLTSENEMHANEDEHEIVELDLSSIPVVHIQAAPIASTMWSRWGGFILLAISAFFFSLMSLFVSMTGGRINSFLLVWIRCVSQFSLGVGAILIQRFTGKLPPNEPWFETIMGPKGKKRFLFARGFVGIFSLSCFYYALTTLKLSDATVLFFTAPIYTGIIGRLVLGETYDLYDAASCLASFVGVILVSRPAVIFGENPDDADVSSSGGQRAAGIIVALVGAFISAWVYIFIRKVGKGVNPFILVHYLGLVGMIGAPFTLLSGSTWEAPVGKDIGYIVGICLFAFCGQFLFNKGGAQTSAGVSALIRNLDIVCSFFWQITVQGQSVNGFSFLGAVIVTGSVVALGVRKWRKEKAKVANERLAHEKALQKEEENVELSKLPEGSDGESVTHSDDDSDLEDEPLVEVSVDRESDVEQISKSEQTIR